jgi:hypothetical protein
MKPRFLVAGAVMLLTSALTPVFSATIDDGSAEFIQSLGDQGLQVIRGDIVPAQKPGAPPALPVR